MRWNNKSITVLGTNIELIDPVGNLLGKRIYPQQNDVIRNQFAYKMPIANPTTVFRRDALIDIGLYNNIIMIVKYMTYISYLTILYTFLYVQHFQTQ